MLTFLNFVRINGSQRERCDKHAMSFFLSDANDVVVSVHLTLCIKVEPIVVSNAGELLDNGFAFIALSLAIGPHKQNSAPVHPPRMALPW